MVRAKLQTNDSFVGKAFFTLWLGKGSFYLRCKNEFPALLAIANQTSQRYGRIHSCQVYRIKMREILTFYCFSFVVNTIGYCILLFIHRVKCGSLQLNAGIGNYENLLTINQIAVFIICMY